jgi:retron-type reverse transcriptase
MKRAGNLFEEIISFKNVLNASRKARKGKRLKPSTARFELNLEKNLFEIIEVLKNKSYEPGGYHDFFIYDPKKRLISAAPYFDRVIHHALLNVIGPILEKSFIFDTYACIKGRGTHSAVERYREFQRENSFVLKCDIQKYFESIDHGILMEMLSKKIKCLDTLCLMEKIISSKSTGRRLEYFEGDDLFSPSVREKGIPIGNLTSQFFANFYLNGFDHFVKETVKARYYIRYCDDFVLFNNSKKWLNDAKLAVSLYLETLRLRLHENKSRVYRTSDGVDFLGYRIYPGYLRVRKSRVKRYRKRLKKIVKDYGSGKIGLETVRASIQSWIGHVKHADSYGLRKELLEKTVFSKIRA